MPKGTHQICLAIGFIFIVSYLSSLLLQANVTGEAIGTSQFYITEASFLDSFCNLCGRLFTESLLLRLTCCWLGMCVRCYLIFVPLQSFFLSLKERVRSNKFAIGVRQKLQDKVGRDKSFNTELVP